MTATLLVSGGAPPTPSICRTSGDPIAANSTRSRNWRSAGRSCAWKYRPFEVPPRISVQGIAVSMWSVVLAGVAIRQSLRRQALPHVVDVQSELARLQLRADSSFLLFAGSGVFEHCLRLFARDDAYAVIIGDDEVTWVHEHSGAVD